MKSSNCASLMFIAVNMLPCGGKEAMWDATQKSCTQHTYACQGNSGVCCAREGHRAIWNRRDDELFLWLSVHACFGTRPLLFSIRCHFMKVFVHVRSLTGLEFVTKLSCHGYISRKFNRTAALRQSAIKVFEFSSKVRGQWRVNAEIWEGTTFFLEQFPKSPSKKPFSLEEKLLGV